MSTQRQINFLLVEDNPDHAELLRTALNRGEIEVQVDHVDNGEDAIALIERKPPFQLAVQPDVVLLDLKLPKVNGVEVLRTIRTGEAMQAPLVIVLTSSQDRHDIESCRELEPDKYLVKPIGPNAFNTLVDELRGVIHSELAWKREYDRIW